MKISGKMVLFLVNLFYWGIATAQDTLVYFEDIVFFSDEEKKAFTSLELDEHPGYFTLASLTEGDYNLEKIAGYHNGVQKFISNYENEGFQKLKPLKKVKKLHQAVHNTYLKKYEMASGFTKIFENGTYNCATASVLFGIVFEALEIPFSIKLMPDHVYLLAWPESESIVVETTNPAKGMLVYDEQYKSGFVDFLHESKLVSEEEYMNQPVDSLFAEHFFTEEDITLGELMGVLYQNASVPFFEKEDYAQAWHYTQKAYYLLPSETLKYQLFGSGIYYLLHSGYNDLECAKILGQISRMDFYSMIDDVVDEAFRNATVKILVEKGDFDTYGKFYQILTDDIRDSSMMSKVSFVYHYETGRIQYNRMEYQGSLDHIIECLKINPNHTDAQYMFTFALTEVLKEISDPEEKIREIKRYGISYPQILDNKRVSMIHFVAVLEVADRYFYTGSAEKGNTYLKMFESEYPGPEDLPGYLDQYVVQAYSSAATHFFRRGNTTMARHYIDKGLFYVPGSFELHTRKAALK